MRWWLLHIVHNCIAHPMLVVAEAARACGVTRLQLALYRFHDTTIPDGDIKNRLRMLEDT